MNILTVKSIAKLLCILFLFPLCLNAQDKEIQTLFGNKDKKIPVFGAIDTKISFNNNYVGLHIGGRGGITFYDNMFSASLAGFGIIPTVKVTCPMPNHEDEKNNYMTGGYGGVFFEYFLFPERVFHFTANALIAAGGITYGNAYEKTITTHSNHPSVFIIVLEPGVGMELNLTQTFRMSLGVSYRFCPSFKLRYDDKNIIRKEAFRGLSVNLTFKFGPFTDRPDVPKPIVPSVNN